ncbi:MAG: helix-turn-helix domain-containing protein [Azonexus sp.]|jgi:transcriptional regulator with XRE-family HTH domain|nr:helix-turn-helix domain-containing protein [Azonexus sp.]
MEIGPVIRRLRQSRGMTLEDLAFATQSDAGNLSRLERGQGRVTLDGLEALAKALGTTATTICQTAEAGKSAVGNSLDERLYRHFRRLSEADKTLLCDIAATMAKRRAEVN